MQKLPSFDAELAQERNNASDSGEVSLYPLYFFNKIGYIPLNTSQLDIYLFKFENWVFIPENVKIMDIYP
jgi:hypothetical protein